MKIKKYKVETYRLRAYCDCGGELVSSNENIVKLILNKVEYGYIHTCNKCGKEVNLPKLYPDEEVLEVEVK
jgi:hypothetical protein